jgi:hypothetical protein
MYDRQNLNWCGCNLRLGKRVVATVEPNAKWPKMYRVRLPNGDLTDIEPRMQQSRSRWGSSTACCRRSPNGRLRSPKGTARNGRGGLAYALFDGAGTTPLSLGIIPQPTHQIWRAGEGRAA